MSVASWVAMSETGQNWPVHSGKVRGVRWTSAKFTLHCRIKAGTFVFLETKLLNILTQIFLHSLYLPIS